MGGEISHPWLKSPVISSIAHGVVFELTVIGDLLAQVARVEVILVSHASEARSIIRIAVAAVLAALRIGAERPLKLNALSSRVVYKVSGDDFLGRGALLYPLLERFEHIVI